MRDLGKAIEVCYGPFGNDFIVRNRLFERMLNIVCGLLVAVC